MPLGPPRHKRAKKKKKSKTDKKSRSLMADHHRHESDGDQHNPLHQTTTENIEDTSSGYESLATYRTQMATEDKPAKIDTNDKRSNLTEQAFKFEPNTVEPDTVADYLSQPFESSPEKGAQEVEDLGFKTPPSIDPSNPDDQSLLEATSQLNNYTKIQENDDLVAADTRLEHTVVNETDSNNNQLTKQNEVQKLDSKSEKTSPKSEKDSSQDSSTNGKCRYCGRSDDDRLNEPAIHDSSERQPLLASTPQPSEKASWKNCCGIFELFSGNTS